MSNSFFFSHLKLPLMLPLDTCSKKLFQLECGEGSLESSLISYYKNLGLVLAENISEAAIQIDANAILCEVDVKKLLAGISIAGLAKVTSSEKDEEADVDSYSIIYPWDLLRFSENEIKKFDRSIIMGDVHELARIEGNVELGHGSRLLPGVFIEGNVVIGKDCKIGPNCYIRGNTRIGDNCHIGQSVEIKNSIIMNGTNVGHLSYVGDSVLARKVNFGAGTSTSNLRHDGKNHRSIVAGELIDTGRRKFGTIVGTGVHTGINTSIYPGRKFSADSTSLPGEVVQKDK